MTGHSCGPTVLIIGGGGGGEGSSFPPWLCAGSGPLSVM